MDNQHRLSESNIENNEVADDNKGQQEIMLMQVLEHLRNWLQTSRLQGYVQVADAEHHPQVAEIITKINVDKITNK